MPTNDTPEEFPKSFVDKVHEYLKNQQQRYSGKYQEYFIVTTSKKAAAFFGPHEDRPRSFQSICCVAGKMCGLFFLTYFNDTPPILLDAVKDAYQKCAYEEQVALQNLFGNKTAEEITEDDLLEIGLYDKIDSYPRSPGERLLRYENLKTIYAGEHQRMNRQESSLPEHIHYWLTLPEPSKREEFLFQSELCRKKYTIKTKKSNDPGKIRIITESKKEPIDKSEAYFLSALEKTLRQYFDGRNNRFYKTFGKKSEASSKLYNTLFDIIIKEDENTSEKIKTIIIVLNDELARIHNLPAEEQSKTRRLINMLTDAGFMCPDVLNYAPRAENLGRAEAASSRPNEKQDAHQAMH